MLVLEEPLILLWGLRESSRNKARNASALSTAFCVLLCACPRLVTLSGSSDLPQPGGPVWGGGPFELETLGPT